MLISRAQDFCYSVGVAVYALLALLGVSRGPWGTYVGSSADRSYLPVLLGSLWCSTHHFIGAPAFATPYGVLTNVIIIVVWHRSQLSLLFLF